MHWSFFFLWIYFWSKLHAKGGPMEEEDKENQKPPSLLPNNPPTEMDNWLNELAGLPIEIRERIYMIRLAENPTWNDIYNGMKHSRLVLRWVMETPQFYTFLPQILVQSMSYNEPNTDLLKRILARELLIQWNPQDSVPRPLQANDAFKIIINQIADPLYSGIDPQKASLFINYMIRQEPEILKRVQQVKSEDLKLRSLQKVIIELIEYPIIYEIPETVDLFLKTNLMSELPESFIKSHVWEPLSRSSNKDIFESFKKKPRVFEILKPSYIQEKVLESVVQFDNSPYLTFLTEFPFIYEKVDIRTWNVLFYNAVKTRKDAILTPFIAQPTLIEKLQSSTIEYAFHMLKNSRSSESRAILLNPEIKKQRQIKKEFNLPKVADFLDILKLKHVHL